jgi:hypothetical protein
MTSFALWNNGFLCQIFQGELQRKSNRISSKIRPGGLFFPARTQSAKRNRLEIRAKKRHFFQKKIFSLFSAREIVLRRSLAGGSLA